MEFDNDSRIARTKVHTEFTRYVATKRRWLGWGDFVTMTTAPCSNSSHLHEQHLKWDLEIIAGKNKQDDPDLWIPGSTQCSGYCLYRVAYFLPMSMWGFFNGFCIGLSTLNCPSVLIFMHTLPCGLLV